MPIRYAICNETFDGWDHCRVCRCAAELGYGGLEIATFTLEPRITDVSGERRTELQRQAEDCGIEIVGLHWLLAKTEGFPLTSPEESVRRRRLSGRRPSLEVLEDRTVPTAGALDPTFGLGGNCPRRQRG